MLGVGRLVAIGYDGLPPRTVGVRTLFSGSIGTGIRIKCLGDTPAPVRTVGGSTACVRPGVRIVGGAGRSPAVRAVNPAGDSVGPTICIIVRTYTVRGSIRTIDGVSTHRITIVRRIVITSATGEDRSNSGASDESPQVSRGVARLNSPLGCSGLGHIRDIVNGRAWRNRVNLCRN